MTGVEKQIMIIGGGSSARKIAEALLQENIRLIVVSAEEECLFSPPDGLPEGSLELLTQSRVVACRGSAGRFHVSMVRNGRITERCAGGIVLAEESAREANFTLYGLASSDRVLSVSQASEMLASGPRDSRMARGETVVFLTGISEESHPVAAGEIMRLARRLQSEFNKRVYILTGNLQVAGQGLERLYRETRQAGVVYVKFTHEFPRIDQEADGTVRILFDDEITCQTFRLRPDWTVVDERMVPSPYLSGLASVLKVDTDPDGFAQTTNVHRMVVSTNRKGIWVANGSRGVQPVEGALMDASNVVLSVLEMSRDKDPDAAERAEIHSGRCIGCLTCFRLCPHHAVHLGARPVIYPEACEGCGICVAECPKGAICLKTVSDADKPVRSIRSSRIRSEGTFVPVIAVFCCNQSAADACVAASETGLDLPKGLKIINLPCGGSLSQEHILSAFRNGADGIMVLTCHKGNCYSETGNIHAWRRAGHVSDTLERIGLEKERLKIESIAANMGRAFFDLVRMFEKGILSLGPSPIKP